MDEVQTETTPEVDEVQDEKSEGEEPEKDEAADYDGMTLGELRAEATKRNLPSYGNKAQLTERLREADAS